MNGSFLLIIAIFIALFAVFVPLYLWRWVKNYFYKRLGDRTRAKINSAVEEHRETLARKRLQLIHTDDYGIVHSTKWNSEVNYFFENVVVPELTDRELQYCFENKKTILTEEVDEKVAGQATFLRTEMNFDDRMTPIQYEHFVAAQIRKLGWDAEVSKGSGDQGADVIAQIESVKTVVQCKLYSKPVGNKAVQEVIGARDFYDASRAIVVTNNGFTPSARRLAQMANVELLHHTEISSNVQKLRRNGNEKIPKLGPAIR